MIRSVPPQFKLRIFIVEDHADTLRVLSNYLRQCGCEVAVATGVEEALKALPGFGCDVLLSDVGLRDGTGWDLLRRAKLDEDVFAIAMSGFCTSADRLKSQEAGFRFHLTKPFPIPELNAILEQAVLSRSCPVH